MLAGFSTKSRCLKYDPIYHDRVADRLNPMDCPECSQTDVLEIEHILPDEIEVRFFFCHNCEEKWWNRDGVDIDVTQVLEMVRQSKT